MFLQALMKLKVPSKFQQQIKTPKRTLLVGASVVCQSGKRTHESMCNMKGDTYVASRVHFHYSITRQDLYFAEIFILL
jgi:hypothetical protein